MTFPLWFVYWVLAFLIVIAVLALVSWAWEWWCWRRERSLETPTDDTPNRP
jgi:hypothetical protein